MRKEWVEDKEQAREIEKDRLISVISNRLRETKLLDFYHSCRYTASILDTVKIGLTDPAYVFNYDIFREYKKRYSEMFDKNTAAQAAETFYEDIMTALNSVRNEISELYSLMYVNYNRYLDTEPMMFEGDIIITDPCYVAKDDDDSYLNSSGIEHMIVHDTLYGDWGCTTFDTDTRQKIGRFCADAGLVAVISLEEALRYNPTFDYHITKPWTTTLIKDFKGYVQIVVKEDKWTQTEDSEYGKKGDEHTDYSVEVVGKGINLKTGKNINFVGKQTSL